MIRKLVFEVLVLLLTVVLACLLIEKRYENFQTPVDVMMQNFHARAPKAEILLLGNSHMIMLQNYLLKNTQVPFTSMAFGGMDFFWCNALVKKNIDQLPLTKLVIMNVDEELFGYNQTIFRPEYTNRSFYRYTDTLYNETMSERFLSKSNFFRSNRNTTYLFSNKKLINFQEMTQPVSLKSQTACKMRALELSMYRYSEDLIEENKKLLIQTIEKIILSGKNLVLITLPKSSCYLSYRKQKQAQVGAALIDSISKAYGLQWINYTRSQLPDSLFTDADHLNKKGSKLIWEDLTSKINN